MRRLTFALAAVLLAAPGVAAEEAACFGTTIDFVDTPEGGGHAGQEGGEAGLRPARLRATSKTRGSPETTPRRSV